MSPQPDKAWGEPSATYDPTCIPKRYSPCPAQILAMQLGEVRGGISPNVVVVIIFLLTIVIWVGCYYGFMCWIGRDIEKIRKVSEEENMGVTRVRLLRANAGNGSADGSVGGEAAKEGGNGGKNKGKGKKNENGK